MEKKIKIMQKGLVVGRGGHKERVNEDKYHWMYFVFIYENRIMLKLF
jgi:hypothetical protein